MRLLVYPHQLVMGGSQINAIELAATVRDMGHEMTIVAPDGPLKSMIADLGLDYVPTVAETYYPSPRTARQLDRLVRERGIDLIHAYEWRPALETMFGPHLMRGTPTMTTVLSMSVPKFLPRHVPLIVGTKDLQESSHAARTYLMEPPIDTDANRSRDPVAARRKWGFGSDEVVLAIVCRMTPELDKLPGVLEAIQAVGRMAATHPVRLLAVGGGEGLDAVRSQAAAVNSAAGREVVVATGQILDPRDAYDAADIVLGMGSSVMRGMAFGRPVVVQGTAGFWRLLERQTLNGFLHDGWFGHGGGGVDALEGILGQLVTSPSRRKALGSFGRAIVVDRFSLKLAAERLVQLYAETLERGRDRRESTRSMARSAAGVAKYAGHQMLYSERRRAQ